MTTTRKEPAAMTESEITAELKELESEWILLETNEGTFGGAEAVRLGHSADPQFCVRKVFGNATGERRASGPSEESAPGWIRYFTDNRTRLAKMQNRRLTLLECLRQVKKP